MTGSSELSIKIGDWGVLRNGEVRGQLKNVENKPDIFTDPNGELEWYENGRLTHFRETEFDIIATLPCPPMERIRQLEEALKEVKHWARSRCPCHEENPNPCPLCGASVENLEACKAVESIFPRSILSKINHALEASQ